MKKLIFIVLGLVLISNYSSFESKDYKEILDKYLNEDYIVEEDIIILEEDKNNDEIIENDIVEEDSSSIVVEESGEEDIVEEGISNTELLGIIKDNLHLISIEDKLRLTTMALDNFSLTELNDWKDKASDGLTDIEKDELKELVYTRFSSEEVAEMKELVYKYLALLVEVNQDSVNVMVDYIEE